MPKPVRGSDFSAHLLVYVSNQPRRCFDVFEQPAVLADAHQVIHIVPIAPAQQVRPIKAIVAPKHDARVGAG